MGPVPPWWYRLQGSRVAFRCAIRNVGETAPVIRTARATWPGRWPAGLVWALWTLTLLGLAATIWLDGC